MAETSIAVPAFHLKELSTPGRNIRLFGRALPYRPLTIAGTQRLEVTWYQGNAVATSTTMGPTEEPTSIKGYWKDKYLSDTQNFEVDGVAVSTVQDACSLIDQIRRAGTMLEVTWGHIARHGHIKKFEQQWHNVHDVEWTIDLEWVSQAEPADDQDIVYEQSSSEVTATLRGKIEDIYAAMDGLDLEPSFLDMLDSALRQMADAMDTLDNIADTYIYGDMNPIAQASRRIQTLTSICSRANALYEDLLARPAHTLSSSYRSGSLGISTIASALGAGSVVGLESFSRFVQSEMVSTSALAAQQRQATQTRVQGNVKAIYRAKDGDDLRDVSRLYNSIGWRGLMDFNGLMSAELEAGQVVLIPQDSTTAGS